MYLLHSILSDMFQTRTSRAKRTCIPLSCVFSECWCGDLLKNYLGESRTLFNLNKFAENVEKYNSHRTSVIGIYDSPTDISKVKCKTGRSMYLAKIISGNFKTNVGADKFYYCRRHQNILNGIDIISCGISRSLCWADCCTAEFYKVNSHLMKQSEKKTSTVF